MTTANKITFFRIILIIPFLYLLFSTNLPYNQYFAAGLFLFLALTDALDGMVARKLNQVSDLGKFLDPLADKFLVIAALVALVEIGAVSSIPVLIIIGRELAILGRRIHLAGLGKTLPASFMAKIKTVLQIAAVLMLILNVPYAAAVLWVAVLVSLSSMMDYLKLQI